MGGRGPTSDISPFSTLMNCGSSSRLVLRNTLPTRVILLSFVSLKTFATVSFGAVSPASLAIKPRHKILMHVAVIVDKHGAEFEEREGLTVAADSLLPVKNRSPGKRV